MPYTPVHNQNQKPDPQQQKFNILTILIFGLIFTIFLIGGMVEPKNDNWRLFFPQFPTYQSAYFMYAIDIIIVYFGTSIVLNIIGFNNPNQRR